MSNRLDRHEDQVKGMRLMRLEWLEAGERTGEGSWTDEVGISIYNDMIVTETDPQDENNS